MFSLSHAFLQTNRFCMDGHGQYNNIAEKRLWMGSAALCLNAFVSFNAGDYNCVQRKIFCINEFAIEILAGGCLHMPAPSRINNTFIDFWPMLGFPTKSADNAVPGVDEEWGEFVHESQLILGQLFHSQLNSKSQKCVFMEITSVHNHLLQFAKF